MPYPPRHAPFDNALELSLLPGISLAVVERVLPFVTVFSGHAEVDVSSADPTVLSAFPRNDASNPWRGAERARQRSWRWACAVGAARSGEVARHNRHIESIPGVNRGRLRQRQACSCGGRVSPQGPRRQGQRHKDQGRQPRARPRRQEPYELLYWRDDFDGPMQSA